MKKKILSATFVVAMAAIAGYNTYVNQNKNEMPDLALANVEALADDSEFDENKKGEVQLKCKGSVVIKCEKICPKCYAKWVPAYSGYGENTDVRGTCTCGHKF